MLPRRVGTRQTRKRRGSPCPCPRRGGVAPEVVRRQRRRELDARRSRCRIRIGGHLERWCRLKEQLGFALHSQLTQFLLDRYSNPGGTRSSGDPGEPGHLHPASLQRLVLLSQGHRQECGFVPDVRPPAPGSADPLVWECVAGHRFSWGDPGGRGTPPGAPPELEDPLDKEEEEEEEGVARAEGWHGRAGGTGEFPPRPGSPLCPQHPLGPHRHPPAPPTPSRSGGSSHWDQGLGQPRGPSPPSILTLLLLFLSWPPHHPPVPFHPPITPLSPSSPSLTLLSPSNPFLSPPSPSCPLPPPPTLLPPITLLSPPSPSCPPPSPPCPLAAPQVPPEPSPVAAVGGSSSPEKEPGNEPREQEEQEQEKDQKEEEEEEDDLAYSGDLRDQSYHPGLGDKEGTHAGFSRCSCRRRTQGKDEEEAQIGPKRIRKAAKREILLCDFEGCGKIFSKYQYLNHHQKYQHVHQKTFTCPEPSCGKSFNFKKHLKEHQKLHSDQRDFICEFCAHSFCTNSNLLIHRRIHNGEKPLQCEICGFTCRQKASLNWHMRKHDADSSCQFIHQIRTGSTSDTIRMEAYSTKGD
ncbi:zinc finger protein 692-like [Pseudopipra pipra]|uniref:zinc finger protein 692-like n=1 Tax=Pseudopipra pipra TaxID=415032 RepID=UPI003138669C